MHLLFLVTVYSTINVRVNNYCVALFLARKKRPFGRFCFVISYVHSEHNVYLFTYFVASSREKLNFSITFSIISSLEMPNSSSEDIKTFIELILSSSRTSSLPLFTALSITSHILMSSHVDHRQFLSNFKISILFITTILLSRYSASTYRFRTRYTGYRPYRTTLLLVRPLSNLQRLLCVCYKTL